MRTLLISLVVALALSSCRSTSESPCSQASLDPERADLLTAVLRVALDDAEQNAQPFEVFCVETDDEGTPPCEVLDGLPLYSRPVLPISRCKKRIPKNRDQQVMFGHSYIDRKTKKGGVQVLARISDWQSPDHATATIGYYKHKYMSELKRVEMEKIDGAWVVVNLTVVIQS